MYMYLDKKKNVSFVRLQQIVDILETYELKVVTVWCHSAVMDHIYDQYCRHTFFLENMSKMMKFKFGIWMLPVIDMCPILR